MWCFSMVCSVVVAIALRPLWQVLTRTPGTKIRAIWPTGPRRDSARERGRDGNRTSVSAGLPQVRPPGRQEQDDEQDRQGGGAERHYGLHRGPRSRVVLPDEI